MKLEKNLHQCGRVVTGGARVVLVVVVVVVLAVVAGRSQGR